MATDHRIYSGTEWQELVEQWLRLRYQDDYEPVPDDHIGDFGIEGFSRDGKVYQCHAPREPLHSKDLYARQRRKLNQDIAKFINNVNDLSRVFGDLKIRRWWLVVPDHKSAKLLQDAATLQQKVKDANLPYVADDFAIHIATSEDFVVERGQLAQLRPMTVRIDGDETLPQEVQDWADENDRLVATFDDKLSRLLGTRNPAQVAALRNKFLQHYLNGQNRLDRLRDEHADLWELLDQCKKDREKFVETECMTPAGTPSETLQHQREQLVGLIMRQVPRLHETTVQEIARGIEGEWLARCDLNFPETKHHG